jgi:copper chaperone CopZ
MMKREFHIKGMHCESCAVEIREQLETTAGVRKADVTFNGKTANVEFDDAVVQEQTLVKKIQDLGYQATVADEPQREARGA